jgi:biotin carboxylase
MTSGANTSVVGATVAVVGAGSSGKRRAIERMAELGARLVVVDEPDHWSHTLVEDGTAAAWLSATVTGDPDVDAASALEALTAAGVRPDGVITFWEDSVPLAARVATALGLATNPPAAVDAARSKVRTRELSEQLGIPSPKAQRVRSLDELFAAAMRIGFPAVVKPEFGASAMGCVRVDDLESLPNIYTLVRGVVSSDHDGIFRAGNDLLLEEYLDGVEFDIDLVMHRGECIFSSVSQNWPTAEPSFQETGLHCPADHDKRAVRKLVDFTVRAAQAFGLHRGVLHIEGKTTSKGPRIVEVNVRMGGGRIYEIVRTVWGVDLVEAQLRSCLDLPPNLKPSRGPQAAVVNTMLHAPASGRLDALTFGPRPTGCLDLQIDTDAQIGEYVDGPDRVFSSMLAEITVSARDLKQARAITAAVLAEPPVISPDETAG